MLRGVGVFWARIIIIMLLRVAVGHTRFNDNEAG